MISVDEIEQHNDALGGFFWVMIESYVLDLSEFLHHHPKDTGGRKIVQKRQKLGVDITPNFIDHCSHTVAKFRQATQTLERKNDGKPVTFQFQEVPDVNVTILGKLAPSL